MSMLGDLTALLEKIPVWKRLKAMPDEVDTLKKRIADLEARLQAPGEAACPKCHKATFELIRTEDDPTFRRLGVQRRVYKCSECGHSEFKQLRPG